MTLAEKENAVENSYDTIQDQTGASNKAFDAEYLNYVAESDVYEDLDDIDVIKRKNREDNCSENVYENVSQA